MKPQTLTFTHTSSQTLMSRNCITTTNKVQGGGQSHIIPTLHKSNNIPVTSAKLNNP